MYLWAASVSRTRAQARRRSRRPDISTPAQPTRLAAATVIQDRWYEKTTHLLGRDPPSEGPSERGHPYTLRAHIVRCPLDCNLAMQCRVMCDQRDEPPGNQKNQFNRVMSTEDAATFGFHSVHRYTDLENEKKATAKKPR